MRMVQRRPSRPNVCETTQGQAGSPGKLAGSAILALTNSVLVPEYCFCQSISRTSRRSRAVNAPEDLGAVALCSFAAMMRLLLPNLNDGYSLSNSVAKFPIAGAPV